MATLVLKNTTGADITITDASAVIVPAGGSDTYTDNRMIQQLASSLVLRGFVTGGQIVVNNGLVDLAFQLGLIYLTRLWTQAGFDSPADRISYVLGLTFSVPTGGTQQLLGPGSTLAAYQLAHAGRITAASVQVNIADPTNAYDLQVRINGVTVASINLAANTLGARSNLLNVAVNEGDLLTLFLVRTSGSGGSDFTEVNAAVEVSV